MLKSVRIPDVLGQLHVQLLPSIEVGLPEFGVRVEGQTTAFDEAQEAGVVVVRILVEAPGKQVLAVVVHELFLVRQIAVAGVEALRQQQEVADTVPVFCELTRMWELVLVTLRMIRPDVLDFKAILAATLGDTLRSAKAFPTVSR